MQQTYIRNDILDYRPIYTIIHYYWKCLCCIGVTQKLKVSQILHNAYVYRHLCMSSVLKLTDNMTL